MKILYLFIVLSLTCKAESKKYQILFIMGYEPKIYHDINIVYDSLKSLINDSIDVKFTTRWNDVVKYSSGSDMIVYHGHGDRDGTICLYKNINRFDNLASNGEPHIIKHKDIKKLKLKDNVKFLFVNTCYASGRSGSDFKYDTLNNIAHKTTKFIFTPDTIYNRISLFSKTWIGEKKNVNYYHTHLGMSIFLHKTIMQYLFMKEYHIPDYNILLRNDSLNSYISLSEINDNYIIFISLINIKTTENMNLIKTDFIYLPNIPDNRIILSEIFNKSVETLNKVKNNLIYNDMINR